MRQHKHQAWGTHEAAHGNTLAAAATLARCQLQAHSGMRTVASAQLQAHTPVASPHTSCEPQPVPRHSSPADEDTPHLMAHHQRTAKGQTTTATRLLALQAHSAASRHPAENQTAAHIHSDPWAGPADISPKRRIGSNGALLSALTTALPVVLPPAPRILRRVHHPKMHHFLQQSNTRRAQWHKSSIV